MKSSLKLKKWKAKTILELHSNKNKTKDQQRSTRKAKKENNYQSSN
jgi:hypothetical protein